ncbi:MAG: hypothetical protein NZ581_07035 [Candidatus Caldarchaeum sp.]|nr:hypothetical protein [Candidatus Caldarchaeum sp.]MDW8435932.1 hypothetical protein [Candidatus Caldarchaeum sp.]
MKEGRSTSDDAKDEFVRDINVLIERLVSKMGDDRRTSLNKVAEKMFELRRRGKAKINHSAMEILSAAHLLRSGYEVDVERELDEVLVCDVYGMKGGGVHIIEVETGFTPPEAALDPQRYLRARAVSKIARYSKYADRFSLATPMYNILDIPMPLLKPPRERHGQEIAELKQLCDIYYTRPPIAVEELTNSRLHSVLVLDIDNMTVWEFSPEQYHEKVLTHVLFK